MVADKWKNDNDDDDNFWWRLFLFHLFKILDVATMNLIDLFEYSNCNVLI